MINQKKKMKVLITGGSGMVGNALKKIIPDAIFLEGKDDCNLEDWDETSFTLQDCKPDCVIHLAAKVGGLFDNQNNNGLFYLKNSLININVLEAARQQGVKKVISCLSTCIYPSEKYVFYPLTENQLHNGFPHESNFGYAMAKRNLHVMSKAYNEQYGARYSCVIPNNLFGECDNFHPDKSHVIPGMVLKFWTAKRENREVTLFGSGNPLREFTYAGDIAKALELIMNSEEKVDIVNIGSTKEISIKNLAYLIADFMDYPRERIKWDVTKSDGQHRKPSSNDKFKKIFNIDDSFYASFEQSLKQTINWFMENYPNVRGVNL